MPTRHRLSFPAIGTLWDIHVTDELTDADWAELAATIAGRIEDFDLAYSRFRADSLVTQMSLAAGRYDLPPDAFNMLGFYERLYHATAGKVTPLIGMTMQDAGYDAGYSFRPKAELTPPSSWESTISYDIHSITLARPALLDFGAAGKGYLVDIVARMLKTAGARSFLINAGGDITHFAPATEHVTVGLENPLDTTQAIGALELFSQSLAASSGSKRKWAGFTHIIDPTTLTSPDILATWVLAGDTMTADGLATALFFTPPSNLRQHFDFQYAIMRADMHLTYSEAFEATIFKVESEPKQQ